MQSDAIKRPIRIGILRGGMGSNYSSSLRSGGDIISHIQENLGDKYKTLDILIDKEGVWHLNGIPVTPDDLISKIDVAWNLSTSNFSKTLESLAIPHVSQSAFSFALENSEELLREHVKKMGVDMPRAIVIPLYQKDFDGPRERYSIKKAKEIHRKFAGPWVVKSFTPDSNMAIHMAKTFPQLVDAIEDGVKHEKSILVEEFISGKVASVHSVANFRNEDVYTFPLGNTFGQFSAEEKEKLMDLSKELHTHIGAKHYLKCNFILNKRGRVYIFGIETVPNLKTNSHFYEVCELVGTKPEDVVHYILEQVL